jgi:hypothetical protein
MWSSNVSQTRSRYQTHVILITFYVLITMLQNLDSLVSLTIDTWTDVDGKNFLSVTGHYIDAPSDSPKDWGLRATQLALTEVDGRHTGKNLARLVVRVVDQYGFRDKVRGLSEIIELTLRSCLDGLDYCR